MRLNINFKKLISNLLVLVFAIMVIVCAGFADKEQKKTKCESVSIKIDEKRGYHFISKEDINHLLRTYSPKSLIGCDLHNLKTADLEKMLTAQPFVKEAQVYADIRGELEFSVKQRVPKVRIFNTKGESFYLDEDGKMMPLSSNYTARVLVVNGNIHEKYKENGIPKYQLTHDIFNLALNIEKDKFLKALIGQVYVDKQKQFILTPRIGRQEIVLGDIENLDIKFKKLKAFYKNVMPYKGWDTYKSINLSYENQVVAKK